MTINKYQKGWKELNDRKASLKALRIAAHVIKKIISKEQAEVEDLKKSLNLS